MVNRRLDLVLRKSFSKIKEDIEGVNKEINSNSNEIKALEEVSKSNMEDLTAIRETLIEFNSLKKKIDFIEKQFEAISLVHEMEEDNLVEEEEERGGFFSRIFKRREEEY
tara:strand:- start:99 stop:428 length:330 start_codon:yes stop_codon:yes gene_type:complete